MKNQSFRLDESFNPVSYEIYLKHDFETFSFQGEVDIQMILKKETDLIKLHIKELKITKVQVLKDEDDQFSSYSIEKEYDFLNLKLKKKMEGKLTLKIEYIGNCTENMSGVFKSNYLNEKEEKKVLLATQFEATSARRCFPCFDEPDFKAVFNLSITCPSDKLVLSNTNVKSITKDKDLQKVTFEPSPIMSTYLLAFVIGEFDYLEEKLSDGLPIRVYTPPGKKDQGRFALDIACKAIQQFEDFFGQKYAIPKLDLVAISDFSTAMENYGLLTFKETYILFDEKESSLANKQEIALVVAHECAHLWFGNLVTMKYWNDLYLNEGFATWKEHYAISQMFPEWKIFDQFIDDHYKRAQVLDGLESSHPIDVEIEYPEQIDEIFDDISYSKGCCVIRMLVDYLGFETFRDGIRYYMERFKFGNASSNDLWDCLSSVSKVDVKSMMSLWTLQKGYPLITISEMEMDGKKIINLKQDEYKDHGKFGESKWMIPISYFTSKNSKEQKFIMKEKEVVIELDKDVEWIKINPNQTGFYRVQYPSSYYKSFLAKAIQEKRISEMDRFGIQSDLLALCRIGRISIQDVLDFLLSYQDEDSLIVWKGVSFTLNSIWNVFKYEENYRGKLLKYGQNLFQNIYKKLGWNNKKEDSHLTILLRYLVLNNLVIYEDSEVMKQGKEIFLKKEFVEPDLRQTLYKIMFKIGSSEEKEEILKFYKKSTFNEEKVRILSEMGSVKDETELRSYLKFGFSEHVKKEDVFYLLRSISSNEKGNGMVWDYFKDNFEDNFQKYSGGLHFLDDFITSSIEHFTSIEKEKEISEFFDKNPVLEAKFTISQCLEKIKVNHHWVKRLFTNQ